MQELILSTLPHTWFIDIDGTICKHNGFKEGPDLLLPNVKEFFLSIPKEDTIILTTSRREEDLAKFLEIPGIRYDQIIYNLPTGERILINDEKPSGLKMAFAISIERDKGIDAKIIIDDEL